MITNDAGIPIADSPITIPEATSATTIAAVSGRSVRSLPRVSSVRRAMVSAPTATAADPTRIRKSRSTPAPNSGATALAMLDVPDEKAIRQLIDTSVTVPTNSRRVVFGPGRGIGTTPERSSSTSEPSLLVIATHLLRVG